MSAAQRADQLKERVYITFSALALTLALLREPDEPSAASAALTLSVGVLGTLLAVFVADVVAHITVHAALPDAAEWRHLLRVSAGSLGVLVLPLLFVAAAALRLIAVTTALHGIVTVLAATLVAVGYLAVRRLRLPLPQRLLVLLAEFALGLGVIALELPVH